MNKKKLMKVFTVLLSGLMVFNMFVFPVPVNAQEVGTYAYEDVPITVDVDCGIYGKVTCTAHTRYNTTTGKYTMLRYTYVEDLNNGFTTASVKSVTCSITNGSVITADRITFYVIIRNLGTDYSFDNYEMIV